MRTMLAVIAVALAGLFGAASLGYAAYVVSRDQVGLPVTKLKTTPGSLAPTPAKTTKTPPRARKQVVPPPPPPPSTTTREPGDDHGGRSRGGSSSGSGHGGRGGDDD